MLNQKLARAMREKIAGDEIELSEIIIKTKVSRSTLYNILHNDNYNPRFDSVERLAVFLKISIDAHLKN